MGVEDKGFNGTQIQALKEAKEKKETHGEMESADPGFLVAQDTCYVGFIVEVDRFYWQTALDTLSNVGFAKVYSQKTSLTAAYLLNDKVLRFFDQHSIRVIRVVPD